MQKYIHCFYLILFPFLSFSQELYSKSFGKQTDPAVVFLHGGPGYNSANFEVITAEALAQSGFFVVVYDRRGEGRSANVPASFTFEETFSDLSAIIEKYQVKQPTLLGHSFGGIVATLFAARNPQQVKNIVLLGAPVSLQETFKTIVKSCKSIYQAKNDSVNLQYINALEGMDNTGIEYSSYCFYHAMQNNFYSPKQPTSEAQQLYSLFGTDATLKKYASKMTYEAPRGFWKHEKYTTLDLSSTIENLLKSGVVVKGIYGKDDGLYSAEQVAQLQQLLGSEQLLYWDSCSHNVFIDQRSKFITALENWFK